MAKPKLDFRHLAIEAILIVFTVSLALALSEWRQQVKRDELVDRVITSLISETNKNLANLDTAIAYHKNLLAELRNGKHVMIYQALADLPFDPSSNDELVAFAKHTIYSSSRVYVDPIEVVNFGGIRYLRTGDNLSSVYIQNDSLFVYGKGNIVLKSASISNNSWEIAQATNVLIELDYELITILGKITSKFEDYESTTDMAINILYSDTGEIESALEDLYSLEMELIEEYKKVLTQLN